MFRTSSHRSADVCSQVTAIVSSWAARSKDHVTHSLWSWGCCCQWTATWRVFVAGLKNVENSRGNPTQGPNPTGFCMVFNLFVPLKWPFFLLGENTAIFRQSQSVRRYHEAPSSFCSALPVSRSQIASLNCTKSGGKLWCNPTISLW